MGNGVGIGGLGGFCRVACPRGVPNRLSSSTSTRYGINCPFLAGTAAPHILAVATRYDDDRRPTFDLQALPFVRFNDLYRLSCYLASLFTDNGRTLSVPYVRDFHVDPVASVKASFHQHNSTPERASLSLTRTTKTGTSERKDVGPESQPSDNRTVRGTTPNPSKRFGSLHARASLESTPPQPSLPSRVRVTRTRTATIGLSSHRALYPLRHVRGRDAGALGCRGTLAPCGGGVKGKMTCRDWNAGVGGMYSPGINLS